MIDFAHNPMLEDDDEVIADVLNPMLEDEDEEVVPVAVSRFGDLRKLQAQPQVANPMAKIVRPPVTAPVSADVPSAPGPATKKTGHRFTGPVSKPENIGKPGYDSLGRKHTPSPRFKPTDKDGLLCAHLAKWRIAYAEDCGQLAFAEPTPMNPTPELLSPSTVAKRFARLRAKGYVGTKRDKRGKTVWGATEDGIDLARSLGFLERDSDVHPKVFTDMGWNPSDHFLQISRVAARLASPAGLFRDSLGIGPIAQSNLLAEHQLRAAFARGTSQWSALTKDGAEADYPKFWEDVLLVAKQKVADGRLAWSNMLAAYPMLWTIGNYGEEKQAHFCDLIVNLEAGRDSAVSQSILVEVELSIKEWDEYVALLTSFAHRLSTLDVVGRVVYFVPTNKTGRDIEKMFRAVDRAEDLGLFESNRFLVLPIYNRDGSELKLRRELGD